ncbi:hypothetical protein P2H44_12260 [Albimonas sp. CAU 1670]|uniref:hypothetical protein n=1 Tax=Albimonas sp. CAU 1670 TaxID=3032599 RepID=UPI0023DB914E|nr:hypothetical protein [Albimonas sp. CAU 1670]MDF2233327.1 hypothetical protein [Albimonas sp. CAU 1670]
MAFETADFDRFDFRALDGADEAAEAGDWLPVAGGEDPMDWAPADAASIAF